MPVKHYWDVGPNIRLMCRYRPTFFNCVLTQSTRLVLVGEKISFGKVRVTTYFILFYFKRENKIRKKTLKE